MSLTVITGEDGQARCSWCEGWAVYRHYHDTVWGMPCADDAVLFEKLCLESFQAGLSWRTILARRDALSAAFHGFDPGRMAMMTSEDVSRLLADARIIRHRGKIEAVIHNARQLPALQQAFGSLAAFVWSFEPAPEDRPALITPAWLQANTAPPAAQAMAKSLRQQGWKFLGPTTCHAFMQSMGLVNDHLPGCEARIRCGEARERFQPPRLS